MHFISTISIIVSLIKPNLALNSNKKNLNDVKDNLSANYENEKNLETPEQENVWNENSTNIESKSDSSPKSFHKSKKTKGISKKSNLLEDIISPEADEADSKNYMCRPMMGGCRPPMGGCGQRQQPQFNVDSHIKRYLAQACRHAAASIR